MIRYLNKLKIGLRSEDPNRYANSKRIRIPLPDLAPIRPIGYLSIATAFRNEAPYLAEWLEFHRMMGVEHVYLYDHGSTDDFGTEILPFARDNFVTVMPWPFPWRAEGGPSGQHLAFVHALSSFGGAWRWMMMIDVDEFLFPVVGDGLPEALSAYEDLPALAVPWTLFGPSGHRRQPSGLVIENYLERSPTLGKPKSIVRPEKVRAVRSAHLFDLDIGSEAGFDEQRRLIDRHTYRDAPVSNVFQLNHYFTRSEEELAAKLAFRRAQGRRAKTLEALANQLNAGTYRDEAILRFLPELKRRLSE